ncbi:hypothetical protein LCGC14_2143200 [marine sediment metagenome]|uniref:Uncharacterized protein n=1 Tax=marine sediment metagenome TaxID=412755 RepID=A0A0F9GAR4_9ZZZZ
MKRWLHLKTSYKLYRMRLKLKYALAAGVRIRKVTAEGIQKINLVGR